MAELVLRDKFKKCSAKRIFRRKDLYLYSLSPPIADDLYSISQQILEEIYGKPLKAFSGHNPFVKSIHLDKAVIKTYGSWRIFQWSVIHRSETFWIAFKQNESGIDEALFFLL